MSPFCHVLSGEKLKVITRDGILSVTTRWPPFCYGDLRARRTRYITLSFLDNLNRAVAYLYIVFYMVAVPPERCIYKRLINPMCGINTLLEGFPCRIIGVRVIIVIHHSLPHMQISQKRGHGLFAQYILRGAFTCRKKHSCREGAAYDWQYGHTGSFVKECLYASHWFH